MLEPPPTPPTPPKKEDNDKNAQQQFMIWPYLLFTNYKEFILLECYYNRADVTISVFHYSFVACLHQCVIWRWYWTCGMCTYSPLTPSYVSLWPLLSWSMQETRFWRQRIKINNILLVRVDFCIICKLYLLFVYFLAQGIFVKDSTHAI